MIGSMISGSLMTGSIKIAMTTTLVKRRESVMTLAKRKKRNTIVAVIVINTEAGKSK
ncbi:hypothetical protein [Bacillus atrophaeus]|uniref:hypothetical protein n=1 Tax=Bacillus atrophaeus TaxID=1452 RepID=UPI0015E7B8D8|nr:hypothetical protein [Bacillus atrophaeus]MCY8521871.1 hypothetical protein [Bacillus atrophaeus]MCY8525600.1 hypothetical protein [Bacillus atrophaeus]MCY8916599.1 hypothetical protein [Bacillus atrophaeus]MCY8920399.1 hypothetical protein [Bacillus atrophaeus]MCY8993263.1 hypothetical protein [Bacillus atrophaeus]